MFENIADLMNEIDKFKDTVVSSEELRNQLERTAKDISYTNEEQIKNREYFEKTANGLYGELEELKNGIEDVRQMDLDLNNKIKEISRNVDFLIKKVSNIDKFIKAIMICVGVTAVAMIIQLFIR